MGIDISEEMLALEEATDAVQAILGDIFSKG